MLAWSYANRLVADFDALLDQYKASEFRSHRRSTIPLLAYWRAANCRLAEFSAATGIPLSGAVALDFEHTVSVQHGKGRASCTDLMILADQVSVAIEGKSSEPRYDDVKTWFGRSEGPNRPAVLSGWLELIGRRVGRLIEIDQVLDLPYQLIHRAASACHPDTRDRWLVYQVFGATDEKRQMYLDDLKGLRCVIGRTVKLRMGLVACAISPSPLYQGLRLAWDAGLRDLHEPVIAGLRAGNLIDVELFEVITI